ncbi:MAG: transposase [Patescibacteria group bacterium]
MPGRNLEKIYFEDSFYHVYNRGVNKELLFRETTDYVVFLSLFKRYLGKSPVNNKVGGEYPWLHKDIELLAFCLMPNHFHALVYQIKRDSMTKLLKALSTSYGMYFNKKYQRIGPLFQSRFKASLINRDEYLQHISRYIHLNPKNYRSWEFSSLPYYFNERKAVWVRPRRILELFDSTTDYRKFLEDYEGYKRDLDMIKSELANF